MGTSALRRIFNARMVSSNDLISASMSCRWCSREEFIVQKQVNVWFDFRQDAVSAVSRLSHACHKRQRTEAHIRSGPVCGKLARIRVVCFRAHAEHAWCSDALTSNPQRSIGSRSPSGRRRSRNGMTPFSFKPITGASPHTQQHLRTSHRPCPRR